MSVTVLVLVSRAIGMRVMRVVTLISDPATILIAATMQVHVCQAIGPAALCVEQWISGVSAISATCLVRASTLRETALLALQSPQTLTFHFMDASGVVLPLAVVTLVRTALMMRHALLASAMICRHSTR